MQILLSSKHNVPLVSGIVKTGICLSPVQGKVKWISAEDGSMPREIMVSIFLIFPTALGIIPSKWD